jgi:hypothetical protein
VGGVVGNIDMTRIENCYSIGSVKGDDEVGGLIGNYGHDSTYNDMYGLFNLYSTSYVEGDTLVGGLIGYVNNADVKKSFATGNVVGYSQVGGLVGAINHNSGVENCYSIGTVSGTISVGGLNGEIIGIDASINNSYWNTQTSGQASSAGGTGRTTAQMTYLYDQNTYVDWDFLYTWVEDDNYDINLDGIKE